MEFGRRNFLLGSLAASGLYGCNPGHLQNVRKLPKTDTGKRLIIIELSGGNDGLNTIVPFSNDNYLRNRPTLALKKTDVIKLNDETGIHDSLSKLADLYFNGEVAVIQGLGYPSPNFSHFKSTALWHVGGDGRKTFHEGYTLLNICSFVLIFKFQFKSQSTILKKNYFVNEAINHSIFIIDCTPFSNSIKY